MSLVLLIAAGVLLARAIGDMGGLAMLLMHGVGWVCKLPLRVGPSWWAGLALVGMIAFFGWVLR